MDTDAAASARSCLIEQPHLDHPHLEMLWLELTARCNLGCTHCYADAGVAEPLEGSMGLGDWLRVIDEAVELGASVVQLIGGEPTLHPHFKTLLAHTGRKPLAVIEVYTNATRLTDEIVGCLKDNGAQLATSFYSREPQVHDAVTQRAGSWRRTVAGIERAMAAGIPIRVGVIETTASRPDVSETIAFLKRMGIRDIGVDAERGVGRARRQAASGHAEDLSQLCGRCANARLCATANGAIYPCVFARRTPLGDARRGLHAALRGTGLAGFRTAMERERLSRLALRDGRSFCNPGPCNPVSPCSPDGPQPGVRPQRA